jgi:aspartate/tyrosine/aromatic aminotransferase
MYGNGRIPSARGDKQRTTKAERLPLIFPLVDSALPRRYRALWSSSPFVGKTIVSVIVSSKQDTREYIQFVNGRL